MAGDKHGAPAGMGIARAALIIMLGQVASRLLGVGRELVIAALFGTTAVTDAFTAASRVPLTVYDLLIGGMISAALIPVFSDYATKDEGELWQVASFMLNLVALVLALAVALLIGLAPQLMWVFGYGYSAETRELSVHLVRFMLPAIIFMGMAGVLTALLYSRQRFTFPAFGVAAYNLGIIIITLLLYRPLGVTSLVLGVIIGALSQLMLQLAGLRKMRYHPGLGISHPGVRRIIRLYTPVALGLVVSAIGVTIDTNLASRTGEGSLAAMRFATTLVQFPLGLFAAATSFAILPSLSRYASQFWGPRATLLTPPKEPLPEVSGQESALGDQPPLLGAGAIAAPVPSLALRPQEALDAYKNTLARGLKMMLLLILPAAIGLVVLRVPLIQLLFQRGEFDVQATHLTALAFLFYSPGLPAAALDQLLIFAFYARKDTVTPVLVGVMGVMVYLSVGASPVAEITMPRLALANSIQWISHALVMFLLLWRSAQGLGGLGLGQTAFKAIVASAAMAGALLLFLSRLPHPDNPGGLALYLALAAGSGLAVYGAALALLRVEELAIIWGVATRTLRR